MAKGKKDIDSNEFTATERTYGDSFGVSFFQALAEQIAERFFTVGRANEVWRLHEPEDKSSENPALCQLFLVDRRFVEEDGLEMRLAISFGGNPFLRDVPRGFLPPPILPGKFIFGIHIVGTKGRQIAMYDQWADAREAAGCETIGRAFEIAEAILSGMSDAEYANRACSELDGPCNVQLSDQRQVEDFEIVAGESL